MNPTSFSQIIGNEDVKDRLSRMIRKKAIGHAFLFAGPEGIGKSLFAWVFAACVMADDGNSHDHLHKIQMGRHPDVHIYRPEGKLGLHSIQSLRQLSEEVYLPSFEGGWKVFIIHDADRMLSYSANALLKTFEEPPPRTLIILLSRSQATLLPTILSRCCTLHFHSLPPSLIQEYLKERYSLEDMALTKIVNQAQGSLGRAIRLIEQGDDSRTYLLNLFAHGSFHDYRALQGSVQFLSEKVEAAKKQREEVAKEELSQIYADQLSPHQQQALEKELEGLTAMALAQEARVLFEHILSWYRDMNVLLLGGSPTCLLNSDFEQEIQQAVQRGETRCFSEVYRIVEEAYAAIQGATPFGLSLENLLLKLDRV